MPPFVFDPLQQHERKKDPERKRIRDVLYTRQSGRCYYCGRDCTRSGGRPLDNDQQADDLFTVEHLVPIAKGGKTILANCVGACKKCNARKGDELPAFVKKRLAWSKKKPPVFKIKGRRNREPGVKQWWE